MKLKSLKDITNHPLTKSQKIRTIFRFLKSGLIQKLCPYPVVYPYIENSKILIGKGMSSAELQLYTGLGDFSEMLFLLHTLNSDDLFVDVGANVGVFTILASGVKKARSISFEPLPATYQNLRNNIAINHLDKNVSTYNLGVGNKKEILKFTENLNSSVNHVILNSSEHVNNVVDIPVDSLDNILKNENPFFLKIDVEGFESKVIEGAYNTLSNKNLKVIVIELNGLSQHFGFDDRETHNTLLKNGFHAYTYSPENRSLQLQNNFGAHDTIYIRDLQEIEKRLKSAPKYKVLNKEF